MHEMENSDRRRARQENEAPILGSGLRRRFPRLPQQPFRRENPAQDRPDWNAFALGDMPDGATLNEMIHQNAAVCRRESPERLTDTRAALRFFEGFRQAVRLAIFGASRIIEG